MPPKSSYSQGFATTNHWPSSIKLSSDQGANSLCLPRGNKCQRGGPQSALVEFPRYLPNIYDHKSSSRCAQIYRDMDVDVPHELPALCTEGQKTRPRSAYDASIIAMFPVNMVISSTPRNVPKMLQDPIMPLSYDEECFSTLVPFLPIKGGSGSTLENYLPNFLDLVLSPLTRSSASSCRNDERYNIIPLGRRHLEERTDSQKLTKTLSNLGGDIAELDSMSEAPSSHNSQLSSDPSEEYIKPVKSKDGAWACTCASEKFPNQTCGYTATRHLVKRHINSVHLQIRPLVCQFCRRRFAQKSNFVTHLNTHTGNKPHACPEQGCDERFADPSGRHRHRKQAHGYIPKTTKKPRVMRHS